jgi:hypothetical protein
MNYDSDDALDRALFALPLEEPPADLRASILTATVFRPAPMFALWELVGLAAITAVVVALVTLVVVGGATLFMESIQTIGATLGRSLDNLTTLAWLAAGGATAVWLSIFTGFQPAVASSNKVGTQQKR